MRILLLMAAIAMMACSVAAQDKLNLDFDSGTPNGRITIFADSAEFSGSGSDFVFRGNVEVIQGEIIFSSGEISAYLSEDRTQLDIVRAVNGANLEWPDGVAEADFATYRVSDGLVGMYGNLEVATEDGRLAGYALLYDVTTDRGQILKRESFEAIFRPDE
ncbi:MAG: hypothetical protein OXI87_14480 [Albidovulum sp.]|nr:hypothetical protein [Albidovulum sp.]